MPYTLDDITPSERARLEAEDGPGAAQRLVDYWNANEAADAARQPVKSLEQRVAELEAEVAVLKAG